jgi:hypothetical protein
VPGNRNWLRDRETLELGVTTLRAQARVREAMGGLTNAPGARRLVQHSRDTVEAMPKGAVKMVVEAPLAMKN